MMNRNRLTARAVAVACSVMMTTVGCSGVVVNVQKKPKNVDLSAIENFDALNLQNSEDFLKHLDSIKVVAIDLLMKKLAERDFRAEVRGAVRNYRKFLIERANSTVKIDDSFYTSPAECREAGLNFNMEEANQFLGIILQTAVLAELSKLNPSVDTDKLKLDNMNPAISSQVAAIGQLILMELGLKIEPVPGLDSRFDVRKEGDKTITTAAVRIGLKEIAGEDIDEATKEADKVENLDIVFTRALGENYIGSFDATVAIGHLKEDGSSETLQGALGVKREAVPNTNGFLHTLDFKLGVKDATPSYARRMVFEQVETAKHQVKITDILNPDTDAATSYTSLIDVKAGTQCKIASGGSGDGTTDEGGFEPTDDGGTTDGADDGSADGTDGGTGTDGGDGGGDGSTDGSSDGGGKDDGKGDGYDDDDDEPGKGEPNYPGQNPSQSPVQSPHQSK